VPPNRQGVTMAKGVFRHGLAKSIPPEVLHLKESCRLKGFHVDGRTESKLGRPGAAIESVPLSPSALIGGRDGSKRK
jgi:hypothetical protein